MNYDEARGYLLKCQAAIEAFPFGPEVAVMKVADKMFATLSKSDGVAHMNLKCDPHEAVMLRDLFPAVRPGYHMNKRHWNTVLLDDSIPRGELERMVDQSYALVVAGLTRRQRDALKLLDPAD
ncbi:MAG: MmcQ/YjbR family DNA-binding protein [Pseudomonadota bacterium]